MKHKQAGAGQGTKTAVDWAALRDRLESVRTVLEKGKAPTEEEKRRILRDRASALARKPPAEPTAEFLKILQFQLAHETYAIETSYVREVHSLKAYTPLPGTPAFVLGLVNIRGQLLTVIDIKKLFELPEKGLTDLNKVIIVHRDGLELGILADAIQGIHFLSSEGIQPTLPTLTDIRARLLRGVSPERVVILDIEKLLADEALTLQKRKNT